MADFIKTLWADKIVTSLYEDNDLNTMFDRSLESYAREQGGNTLVLPTLGANGSIARSDNKSVGSGLPLAINDLAKNGLELNIYEFTYGPILVRKVDEIQSNEDLLNKNVAEVTKAFKEFIFGTVMSHLIATVHADHKLKWSGLDGGLRFEDIVAMFSALGDAKVLEMDRYAAIPFAGVSGLFTDDMLKNWFAVNQSAIAEGKIPALGGFGSKATSLVPKTKADGTVSSTPGDNVYANVLGWRKQHVNLVVQTEMEIIAAENPQYLGTVASFTNRFGVLLDNSKGAVQSTQQAPVPES